MKIFSSKKGSDDPGSGTSVVGGVILVLLIIAGLVYFILNTTGKTQAATNADCGKAFDGFCAKSIFDCGEDYEPEALAKCTKELPICCKLKVQEMKGSLSCADKTRGQQCGETSDNTVCDQFQRCITKCDFCKASPTHTICANQKNSKGIIVDFNSGFGCTCTKTECENKEGSGECIKGFCGQSSPNYCCE